MRAHFCSHTFNSNFRSANFVILRAKFWKEIFKNFTAILTVRAYGHKLKQFNTKTK